MTLELALMLSTCTKRLEFVCFVCFVVDEVGPVGRTTTHHPFFCLVGRCFSSAAALANSIVSSPIRSA